MSRSLRVVFAGTPEFALPCLRVLLAGSHPVVAVLTQPDRPAGRGRLPAPSPVKLLALEAQVPVMQPESLKSAAVREALAALRPDLMVVVAYGLILPKKILSLPRYGCWNLHASLLPRWRGAAPIQRAIEAGDTETGVCLMRMEAGLDTGPVLDRQTVPILDSDTSATLHERLAQAAATLLQKALIGLGEGREPVAQPQSDTGVTYAPKIDKAEATLDLAQPAAALCRKIRAWIPWPIAEMELWGERVRVHQAQCMEQDASAAPGTVLAIHALGIDVATGHGVLRLQRIQRAGGRVIAASDHANARQRRPPA